MDYRLPNMFAGHSNAVPLRMREVAANDDLGVHGGNHIENFEQSNCDFDHFD